MEVYKDYFFNDLPVDSYMIWGGVSDIHLMYEERVDERYATTNGWTSKKMRKLIKAEMQCNL